MRPSPRSTRQILLRTWPCLLYVLNHDSDRDSSIDVLDLSKRVDDTLDILSVFGKDGDGHPS